MHWPGAQFGGGAPPSAQTLIAGPASMSTINMLFNNFAILVSPFETDTQGRTSTLNQAGASMFENGLTCRERLPGKEPDRLPAVAPADGTSCSWAPAKKTRLSNEFRSKVWSSCPGLFRVVTARYFGVVHAH